MTNEESQPKPLRVKTGYVSSLSKNFSNKELLHKNRLLIQLALPTNWARVDDLITVVTFKVVLRGTGLITEEATNFEYALLLLWLGEIGIAELDKTRHMIRKKRL
jgi:hypothetical protein